jgi:predicted SnoaL-like aldol condensation-catalyzing enzyme
MNYRIMTIVLTFSAAVSIFFSLSEQQKQQNVLGQLQQQQQEKEKDSSSSINHMNKSIVVAFTQAFNNRNITALDKLVSVNEIEHNLLAYQGLHGVKQYFSDLMTAFPDLHITIDHIIADGNNVVVFTNTTGTPGQPLISAAGIPISGKNISFKTADLYRIADNKIAEHWDIIENVKMLQSLGLIKSTSQKILPTNNK